MSADDAPTVYVFYDYVCPYAYIGKHRADRIEREYDVDVVRLPWEIHPSATPEGRVIDYDPPEANMQWLETLAGEVDADPLEGPETTVNSNLALRGALFAKDEDVFDAYHDAAFDAVWGQGRNLGDEDVLADVAERAGLDPDRFFENVRHQSYQFRLDLVDDYAQDKVGVQRVPTFAFGDQRIVGNDRFEPSLKRPLEAFIERRKLLGAEGTTTLKHDVGLARLG
jgi:predicted DsbA family dithiol-disulfide isomerase